MAVMAALVAFGAAEGQPQADPPGRTILLTDPRSRRVAEETRQAGMPIIRKEI